jgi:hypothetical protein
MRPPTYPAIPAAVTMYGKGTEKAKIATNAASEMLQSSAFLSAREPMRQAANSTIAVTAGLMP